MNNPLILFTVSGPDHPGITSELMTIIDNTGDSLIDMGQAVTHGLLSLSFVVELKDPSLSGPPVLKELLFKATQMGLSLTYIEVQKKSELKELTANNKSEKFILNCVCQTKIEAAFVADIAKCLAEHKINIQRIDNVRPNSFNALEITTSVDHDLDEKEVKKQLLSLSNIHKIDIAFLKDNVFRRSKRLIVFDMDSTLIQTEVIDEMADVMGVGEMVRQITHRAMNGEIDFDQSLEQRVALLKGLSLDQMKDILIKLPYTPGVQDFIKTVKNLGYKVALISGGFNFFAEALKENLDLDYAFANDLEIKEGLLTGKVTGTIINANQKALLVKMIAQQEKISLEQVVAIGDGANDLPMLSTAGLGIAFHAKEKVKEEAANHMSHGPMTSILYFLGIPGTLN